MTFEETSFGLIAENTQAQIVFFNKSASLEQIRTLFQKNPFHRLHQTHSDISAIASEKTEVENPTAGYSSVIGDSLISIDSNFQGALGVSTADCLPVILVTPTAIAAIHAGWKGVENEIILKTLQRHFEDQKKISAFIGPHIQWSSFEVDIALGEKFNEQYAKYIAQHPALKALGPVLKSSEENSQKSFVNLSIIAKCQLNMAGVSDQNIWISDIDTKTNAAWASFRREGKNMGKNLGFVSRRQR